MTIANVDIIVNVAEIPAKTVYTGCIETLVDFVTSTVTFLGRGDLVSVIVDCMDASNRLVDEQQADDDETE